MTTPPTRIATALIAASTLAAAIACRADNRSGNARNDASVTAGPQTDLYLAVCDGKRYCDDFDSRYPERFFDAFVGVTACDRKDVMATLFGYWQVADAEARPFEWKADVRLGGLLPSLGHTITSVGCSIYRPQSPLASAVVALDPDGFAWAQLEGEDVFIPFRGEATIDHEFHATAALEPLGDAATPAVTVSVEGPHDPRTVHRGLGRGDRFPWGGYIATLVRVVTPQDGVLGAIGWVEIGLSAPGPGARDR